MIRGIQRRFYPALVTAVAFAFTCDAEESEMFSKTPTGYRAEGTMYSAEVRDDGCLQSLTVGGEEFLPVCIISI